MHARTHTHTHTRTDKHVYTWMSDQRVKMHEKRLTPYIIWYELILYVEKRWAWKLEVKLQQPRKRKQRTH